MKIIIILMARLWLFNAKVADKINLKIGGKRLLESQIAAVEAALKEIKK